MNKQILKLLSIIICVYIVSALFPKVEVGGAYDIIGFSLLLVLLSLLLRPLILLITLPINLFTFGLLSIVTNAGLIMLTDKMIKGININGFWTTMVLASLIMIAYKNAKEIFSGYAK